MNNFLDNIIGQEVHRRRQDYRYFAEWYEDWIWSSTRDERDIFDLTFLFNEETADDLVILIEDQEFAENPGYYRNRLYYGAHRQEEEEEVNDDWVIERMEVDHHEEEGEAENNEDGNMIEEEPEEEDAVDRQQNPENERWDLVEWPIMFNMRLGFHTQYDSGVEMSEEEEEEEQEDPLVRQLQAMREPEW